MLGNWNFYIVQITLNIFVAIVHSCCLFLLLNLRRSKKKFSADRFLLACLSGTEITYSVASAICCQRNMVNDISTALKIFRLISCGILPMNFCVMVLITAHRLVGAVYPIRYRTSVTKTKVILAVICYWLPSSAFCNVMWMFSTNMHLGWLVSNTSYLIFTIFAYWKIYKKLAESRRRVTYSIPGEYNMKMRKIVKNCLFHQGHMTALMIVASYFFFAGAPAIVVLIVAQIGKKYWNNFTTLLYKAMGICTSLNYLTDAFVYMCMNKDIRKNFGIKMKSLKSVTRRTRSVVKPQAAER